jgi:hypothetical protein
MARNFEMDRLPEGAIVDEHGETCSFYQVQDSRR